MPSPVYDDQKPKEELTEEELREIEQLEAANTKPGYVRQKVDAAKDLVSQEVADAKEQAKETAKKKAKESTYGYVKNELLFGGNGKKGRDGLMGKLTKRMMNVPFLGTRRRGIFAGFWSLIILAAVTLGLLFTFASGPTQFVHFAQYLQETHFYANHFFLNNRLGKAIIFAKTANEKERRNLSVVGNQFADHYEKRLKAAGITPDYENTGRMRALVIDTKTDAGKKAVIHMREMGIHRDFLQPGSNGVLRIDLTSNDTRFRRLALSGMVNTLDLNGVSAAMGARLLKLRAGVDFHPFKNVGRDADEKFVDYAKRVREDIEKRIKTGTNPMTGTATAEEGTDADGEPVDNDEQTQTAEGAEEITEAANGEGTLEERTNAVRNVLTSGYGVVGLVALMCGIQAVGDAAQELTHNNVNLPLIRTGMRQVAMGSQIQGDIDLNPEELDVNAEYFYNEKNQTSWVDHTAISQNLGHGSTDHDLTDAAKPSDGDNKPVFFKVIDDIIGSVPGGDTFCDAVTTTLGGWVLTGIGILLTATGPINALLSLAGEIASDILINAFLDDIIAWLAADQIAFDSSVEGATWGGYADSGSFLASNDSSIAMGGTQMTERERQEWNTEQKAILALENENKSFFARYFDTNNFNSLATASMLSYVYPNNATSVKGVAMLPFNVFSKLAGSFANVLIPKTGAQEPPYNYGVDRFGYTIKEFDNPDYEDPYRNEDLIVDDIEELNEDYGEPCFHVTIDPETGALKTGATIRYDEIEDDCKDRSNSKLTRYRYLLADTTAVMTAACYESIKIEGREPCAEVGLVVSEQDPAADENAPPAGSGKWVWPIAAPISPGPCFGRNVGSLGAHAGMDINTTKFENPVLAMYDGTVVQVSTNGSSAAGNYVMIKANTSPAIWYAFQHLKTGSITVKVGDKVTAGQMVAYAGKTGRLFVGGATQGHLHVTFATRATLGSYGNIGSMLDPMKYLPTPAPGGYKCTG